MVISFIQMRREMTRITRLVLLAVVIFTGCVQSASATGHFQNYTCSQSNPFIANTPVTISFDIVYSAPPGRVAIPSGDTLEMITYLKQPKWNYQIFHNGMEKLSNSVSGSFLDLESSVLSSPANVSESIHVTLEGSVPTVNERTHMVLLTIAQNDARGNNVNQIGAAASIINPNRETPSPAISRVAFSPTISQVTPNPIISEVTPSPIISQVTLAIPSTSNQTQNMSRQGSILDRIAEIFKNLFGIKS